MFRRFRENLFYKLLATLFLVVAVAFAVEAWLVIEVGRGAIEQLVGENLSGRALDALKDVERYLLDRCADVNSWSALSVMDEVLVGDKFLNIENELLELQRAHAQYYVTLTVTDKTGKVIASSDLDEIGKTVSLPVLAIHPVKDTLIRMSDFPSRGSVPSAFLALVHPIVSRLSSDPCGWLVARVSWKPVERIISGPGFEEDRSGSRQSFLLADRTGQVLAGDSQILDQLPHTFAVSGRVLASPALGHPLHRVGDYLVAEHQAPAEETALARGLRVIAFWKKDEAFAFVTNFVRAVIWSAALGLALAAGVASLTARTIAARLRKLTEGTDRLARGELSYRVEEGRHDEFGRLARSFNVMASQLTQIRGGLEAAVARWRAIVTHAPDIIMTVDQEGEILFINRVVQGYRIDEVQGLSIYSFAAPEYYESLRAALDGVFETSQPDSLDLQGAGPAGSTVWYSSRIGPVVREGKVVAATIIATDITHRKRLEREILEATERERERIGRDLHDGLGQVLTGISLLSRSLQQKLEERALAEAGQARQIEELIRDAIQQTRTLSRGLFPAALDKAGLKGSLEDFALGVEQMFQIPCVVEGEFIGGSLDHTKATHLFRIAQEAVSNAVRHGKATRIWISLGADREGNELSVRDDGVGVGDVPPVTEGVGMRSMRYRAEVIGASFEIASGPQGGTTVRCRFQ